MTANAHTETRCPLQMSALCFDFLLIKRTSIKGYHNLHFYWHFISFLPVYVLLSVLIKDWCSTLLLEINC